MHFGTNVYATWRYVFPRDLQYGYYIEMGGYEMVSSLIDEVGLPYGFRNRVTPRGALELARVGLLPEISWEMVNDVGQSGILGELVVYLQAGWMIIQCLARVHQSLPLTLLEVQTVTHAIYAFFIYCLWSGKPKFLATTKIPVDSEMLQKLKSIEHSINSSSRGGGGGSFRFTGPRAGSGRSSSVLSHSKLSIISRRVINCVMCSIYGGVHLTMRNGHFPSNLERILWIASAFSIVGLPFLATAWEFLSGYLRRRLGWEWLDHHALQLPLISGCLVLARIYLLVESFASLRNLPLGAYDNIRWVSVIPHF